jgi:hypothetical protein
MKMALQIFNLQGHLIRSVGARRLELPTPCTIFIITVIIRLPKVMIYF